MRIVLLLLAFGLFCPSAIAQKPEPKYNGKPLSYWVERLQKAETVQDQGEAGEAIKIFGSDAASTVPTLIEMLDDRSITYRKLVTDILCKIGPGAKESVPDLLKRLKEMQARKPQKEDDFGYSYDIGNLIQILGSIGPDAKDAVPVLIVMLTQTESYLRDEVVLALCNIGPAAKEAIPELRRVIIELIINEEKKSNGSDRFFLTYSDLESFSYRKEYKLHQLGPDVLPLLFDLLNLTGFYGNRLAFREIVKLGPSAKKAAPKLIPFLQSKNPQIKFYTAMVLWRIEKNMLVMPVLAALLTDDNPELVRAVAESLGGIGPDAKEALPALKLALKYKIESPPTVTTDYPFAHTSSSPESLARTAAEEAIKKISPEPKK